MIIFDELVDMYDSYSSDQAANPEPDCESCHKQNCTCDEDTMQAMENERDQQELIDNEREQ